MLFTLDFALLSIHDIQLSDGKRINKKDVLAYVFLGDKFLDTLVLGSASSNIHKQNQDNQQSSSLINPLP